MSLPSLLGVLSVLLLTLAGQATVIVASSDFSSGIDGWLVSGDSTSATPVYNPAGYITADDDTTGGTWYWEAPAKFLGDRSLSYGETLSFELRQSNTSSQFNNSDVILEGATISLHYNHSPNPGTTFTPYSIPLTEAGWFVGSLSGAAATQGQFQAVLADLDGLRIRGEFRSGPDTGALDNVVLTAVPEPGAAGICAIALLNWCRRRRS